jgi:hypothetical protein
MPTVEFLERCKRKYEYLIRMPTTKDVSCELCSMTFTSQQEKEEHKKLEHKEHRGLLGVG